MISKELRMLVLGDIHLGNRRTPTKHIIENMRTFFNGYKKRTDIDIIFITGDVFDTNLYLSDSDVTHIYNWFVVLIDFCIFSNIKLRVLLGTYSHDHNQTKLLELVAKNSKEPIDFRYITQLEIEYIDDFNLNVLYIPDEWNSNNFVTLEQTKELIKSKGLERVDLAIMHGAFDYQLPTNDKSSVHDSEAYKSLVNYYIFIGHVHTFNVNDSIIAQGSFDRLTHNDEIAKGGVLAIIRPDSSKEYIFIENKNALPFISFNANKDDWYIRLETLLKSLEKGYVRICANSTHPAFSVFSEIKMINPEVKLSKKIIENEQAVVKKDIYLKDDILTVINITPSNIYEMVSSLLSKDNYESTSMRLKEIL